MKHTLIPALAILLLAATGWGETNYHAAVMRMINTPPTWTEGKSLYDDDCDITNDITLVRGQTNDIIIGTSPPPVVVSYGACSASNTLINVESHIRKLAASGEICKVFGHWYPNVWIGERKCKLCGKVETKTEVWK